MGTKSSYESGSQLTSTRICKVGKRGKMLSEDASGKLFEWPLTLIGVKEEVLCVGKVLEYDESGYSSLLADSAAQDRLAKNENVAEMLGYEVTGHGRGKGGTITIFMQKLPLWKPYSFVPYSAMLGAQSEVALTHGPGAIAVGVATSQLPFFRPLWDKGGKGGGPTQGFNLIRFDALCYTREHPVLASVFSLGVQLLHQCTVGALNGLLEFCDDFSALTPAQRTSKLEALSYLESQVVQPHQPGTAKCLYTFHGCKDVQGLLGIIEGGFVALHRNDGGFFGGGIYVTTSVEYAARYASGDPLLGLEPGTPVPAGHPWMPPGCFPVVLCASMVVHTYPVTFDTDYRAGRGESIFNAARGTPAKALKPGYDSHLIPVTGPAYQASVTVAEAEYWELVQSKEAMVVPMGILWVTPE
jgi:hypothetical protein